MKAKILIPQNILGNSDLPSNRERLIAMLKSWRQPMGYFSILTVLPAILASQVQEVKAEEVNTAAAPEPVTGQNAKQRPGLRTALIKPGFLRRQNSYLLPHQKSSFDILAPSGGGDDCPGTTIPGGIYTASAPYVDSGDTTGANDTVTRAFYIDYVYYNYDTAGPDQVYTFMLTARGANPEIQVSTTSPTYRPVIYILDGRRGTCPGGTGNRAMNELVLYDSRWPKSSNFAVLSGGAINSLPLNVPLHLFVDSRHNDASGSGSYSLRMQNLTTAPAPPAAARPKFDFDGDQRADISVFRPTDRTWYLDGSTAGVTGTQFGLSTDQITPADFDGDGKTDIAVYRDGLWLWLNSSNSVLRQAGWGIAGDTPLPADYTGDGRAELAVYRGGTWFVYNIATGLARSDQFGLATDRPVAADYDGDGRTDYGVYRDGVWYLSRSTDGFAAIQFGLPTDKLIPADYDGDGKTDLAVYRDGTWYLQRSMLGFTAFQFGEPSDTPVPADYDGNGRVDAAVFRNGVWYLQQSTGGFTALPFGLANDQPVPAAYLP